jgi:deoxyribodipyrimidine photo-lyase
MTTFEPTAKAARARLVEINPATYARSRNSLEGAVTHLSPYITHGILTIPEAVAHLMGKYRLNYDDKIVFEFAWREFFHHAWLHLGDKILSDVKPAFWQGAYAQQMPDDVLTATTGVAAIDQAVTELYATGYLHNHARMWLASYLVHLRKVHWRVGAEWMYSYLLDGDLGSNHLSWQWVGATFSAKPYLFNAENVEKFAPAIWHSRGTAIDQDYAVLEDIAKTKADLGCEPESRRKFSPGVSMPSVFFTPPKSILDKLLSQDWPAVLPADLVKHVAKKSVVHLVHPWNMSEYLVRSGGRKQRLGIIHLPFHAAHPWSMVRWEFVLARMRAVTDMVFIGDANDLVTHLSSVHCVHTDNPGYRELLRAFAAKDLQLETEPTQFTSPEELSTSFTRFYQHVRQVSGKLTAVVDNRF